MHHLNTAAADELARGEAARVRGHVWAIDPAELELRPLPRNVTHVNLTSQDAAETLQVR